VWNLHRILVCLALFAVNALICWPLFGTEYLDQFPSNEGAFITFGKFLRDYWPHSNWFPWFNVGMPFENAYLPLLPALIAITASLVGCSPAHAFHFLTALVYSLSPIFLFLFALKMSGRLLAGFWAALVWSLFSPSVLIPRVLQELGSPWGSHRLMNIVYWGETPHSLALCLLPMALLFLTRYLEMPSARRFAVAVITIATVMLSNAFGIVVVSISSLMLFAARERRGWKQLTSITAVILASYLLICRFLPPSLIQLILINSQTAGGDYRFTLQARMSGGLFLVTLIALWAITRRLPNVMLRFAVLFVACFGGIAVMAFWKNISLLPQPHRYTLEMEAGACLLAAFALDPVFRRLPRKYCVAAAAICALPLSWAALQDWRMARRLIHPVDIARSSAFRQARWIDAHYPGQRVLIAGENEWWFNLFANNPQLSGGNEATAPNWMQRVAVYTIHSGMNAGDQDGPISVFWLKAFGCSAVMVPQAGSSDSYHAILNPKKFDGLLPLVWRERDDSIYQVPLRSTTLAHVIPVSAIVNHRPIHGLDIEPARPYVAALDDPSLPVPSLRWENPEDARIFAKIAPEQAVSVQITYDPGWRASVAGHSQRVRSDQLGMIIIEPNCLGDCAIDLEYTGGMERRICFALASVVGLLLLGMLFW